MPASFRRPRVVTRAQLLAGGMTCRSIECHLAAGRFRRVLPSTYLTADTLTPADRLDAALLWSGPTALLSGSAALHEHGVRGVPSPDTVLVLVPPSCRLDSHGFVRVRRTHRPTKASAAPGRRRVLVARAVADHALELRRIDDVRALVARVVGDHLTDVESLAVELEAGPRNGSGLLRRALDEVAQGAASAPEARAAAIMRRAGISGFEQNARITFAGGRYVVADFLWRNLRAILEIDSVEYHLGPAEWAATMDRHLALSTAGYSVVHRRPSDLRDATAFAASIAAWLHGLQDARTALPR